MDLLKKTGSLFHRIVNIFLNSGIKNNKDIPLLKSVRLTNVFGIILFLYMIIMGTSVFLAGDYSLGIFDYTIAFLYAVNYVFLRITKKIKYANSAFTILLGTTFIFLIITGGKSGTGFLWSVIFPVVAFQLCGHKKGLIYSILFILIHILMLIVLKNQSWIYNYAALYSNINIITSRLVLALIALIILSYTASKSRYKQYEEIKKADAQKTNFFINLAHETKTPLTLISNYLDKYINKNTKAKELYIVKQNFNELMRNMVNFLDMEKLERGQTFYEHNQIINLSVAVKMKVLLFNEIANKKDITIQSDIEKNINIKIDPYAIDRIINNLMDNAIRYSDLNGKIEVKLKTISKKVELTISDNGIGISKNQQEHIFKAYHQISHEKRNILGIGMGLNIVKKIMDEIDSEILINSELGKGTEFKIIFKKNGSTRILKDIEYSVPIDDIRNEKIRDTRYSPDKNNLLVVEDNKQMLIFIQSYMSSEYNFFYALNGKEALLKLLTIPKPHVIVSDIMMDIMDGYEFYDKLLENPQFNSIPFIFLTAKSSENEKLIGLQKGAIDFISKPFSIKELQTRIKFLIINQERLKNNAINNIGKYLYNFLDTKGKDKEKLVGTIDAGKKRIDVLNMLYKEFKISQHELEIINLLRKGLEYKEIAVEQKISMNTVKTYIKRIYKKCNVNNKIELLNIF